MRYTVTYEVLDKVVLLGVLELLLIGVTIVSHFVWLFVYELWSSRRVVYEVEVE
jgi:hypothetical protein